MREGEEGAAPAGRTLCPGNGWCRGQLRRRTAGGRGPALALGLCRLSAASPQPQRGRSRCLPSEGRAGAAPRAGLCSAPLARPPPPPPPPGTARGRQGPAGRRAVGAGLVSAGTGRRGAASLPRGAEPLPRGARLGASPRSKSGGFSRSPARRRGAARSWGLQRYWKGRSRSSRGFSVL